MFYVYLPGIPPNDLKEHERQKQGSRGNESGSDDDEPAIKRTKPEGLLGSAPGMVPGVAGMVQGMMPPPGMPMGAMLQMAPPFMTHPG